MGLGRRLLSSLLGLVGNSSRKILLLRHTPCHPESSGMDFSFSDSDSVASSRRQLNEESESSQIFRSLCEVLSTLIVVLQYAAGGAVNAVQ